MQQYSRVMIEWKQMKISRHKVFIQPGNDAKWFLNATIFEFCVERAKTYKTIGPFLYNKANNLKYTCCRESLIAAAYGEMIPFYTIAQEAFLLQLILNW